MIFLCRGWLFNTWLSHWLWHHGEKILFHSCELATFTFLKWVCFSGFLQSKHLPSLILGTFRFKCVLLEKLLEVSTSKMGTSADSFYLCWHLMSKQMSAKIWICNFHILWGIRLHWGIRLCWLTAIAEAAFSHLTSAQLFDEAMLFEVVW